MKLWYERYGVWVALSFFVLISVVSLFGFGPTRQAIEMMCSPADKGDCLRQWVSATSGWFGGAITFATLIVLSHQIRDVRQHHRETMTHANRPAYLRAKRVIDAVNLAKISLEMIEEAVTQAEKDGPSIQSVMSMLAVINLLITNISKPEFDSFENDVGYVGVGSVFFIRNSLQTVKQFGDLLINSANADPQQQVSVQRFSRLKSSVANQKYTEIYLESIAREAQKFKDDWDKAAVV